MNFWIITYCIVAIIYTVFAFVRDLKAAKHNAVMERIHQAQAELSISNWEATKKDLLVWKMALVKLEKDFAVFTHTEVELTLSDSND